MTKKTVLFFSLWVFLLLLWPGLCRAEEIERNIDNYKKEVQQKNKNLDDLKTKIKEKSLQSEKLKGRELDISAELKRINAELAKIQAQIAKLNKKIDQTRSNIIITQDKLTAKGLEKEQSRRLLKNHLYFLYKYQCAHLQYLPVLLNNTPYSILISNDKYLRSITSQNLQLYQQIKGQEAEIAAFRKELEGQEQQLEKLQQQVRDQEEVALKQQDLKASLLAQVKEQRKSTEDDIAQLKKESQELQNLVDKFRSKISGLEKEKARIKKFNYARKKGAFDWPVQGKVISNFGKQKHASLNTYVINNGIEISAPAGTDVLAIEQGNVLYADIFKSYGLMVIIDHGDDFYTVYAHLGATGVKENTRVLKGQVIGQVGNGKNGHSNVPNLYFELRQDGKPEDPLLWLK